MNRLLPLLVVLPLALSGCESYPLAGKAGFPDPAEDKKIAEPTRSQMMAVAVERKRVANTRGEVVKQIAYLERHLGLHRADILDMNDSLLVTLPGRGLFQERSFRLTDKGIDAVARIAAALQSQPDMRVAITGHVRGTKSAERDQVLSERRAMAVKSVLISHGVDACRVGVLGKGADDHIAAPVTERRNQHNDRVEIFMMPIKDNACG